jgi:D-glycero-alpha-D-manno-heptose-7-phosphate kinase
MPSVVATAPLRVCDAGGWTDTWFAGSGSVCTLAVGPGVEVRATTTKTDGLVELSLPAFGEPYAFALGSPPGSHPLVEAAIRRWAPRGTGVQVKATSVVSHGLGAGGSGALVVAIVAALRALAGANPSLADIARGAHEVETVELGWQSGVQDQYASAHGGACLITIDRYPNATVTKLDVPDETWTALDARLITVSLGRPHRSTAVHEWVIERLERGDETAALLAPLRDAAHAAAEALQGGDLVAYAEALTANTEAQAALHPALVCDDARRVIDLAKAAGALGWKVNGAGGNGGSVSIIGPADPATLRSELEALEGATVLDLRPSVNGLTIRPINRRSR